MFTATSPDQMPDLDTMLSMSGLEFMQAMRDGQVSRPPISAFMNYALESVEAGKVVFRGTPAFEHTNPAGGVHGGWYGTLLDSCMSCAVMTMTPKGSVYTTLEYKVNLTGAIPVGAAILATGIIDHAGRSTGVAHGEIRDANSGKLYATGSATCLIMKLR
ncbi:MAG: PaaI family thioesterase [Yoonia sp.]|uniref:PaaI family thioesterase n=1 Tax=Yoonia sp. TaxID=2212373 RepID=UPI00273EA614|nr:PaaI family thioesterase [Yoonia sp.]MDP5085189.1 PaaI family thioesterase [Yoonia sp.]MDP5361953.1 PaaI family thioesterase [Paracoccaceae bacterium]